MAVVDTMSWRKTAAGGVGEPGEPGERDPAVTEKVHSVRILGKRKDPKCNATASPRVSESR